MDQVFPAAELEAFLKERRSRKRAALVEQLLSGPEYPRHLREVFDVVLMGKRSSEARWNGYLEWSFQTNRPWNQIVRDMLLARPENLTERGAVRFIYDRKDNHQAIVEAVSPALFGVQIQCAQCHNHPLAPEIVRYSAFTRFQYTSISSSVIDSRRLPSA